MAESLADSSTVRFFGTRGMPRCDVAIFVKERPEEPYRRAVEHGCPILYMPVDFYRSRAQLDADAPFLASCSGLLVHSRRLGAFLARHNSAISYVDHPNLHGLRELPPYRPSGYRLWVGDFLNLPYLLRWCEETGQSRELTILTNGRHTSLRGMAMTLTLADRLGVELDVRLDRVNGIPMVEWDPARQRELMSGAKAALDIKGGEEDFAQFTKPPTKAHQFIVSGIPFATNREASAVQDLREIGFDVADVDDHERWLSPAYWRSTQEFSTRLERWIRPDAVAAVYRRCVDEAVDRARARTHRHAAVVPPQPPLSQPEAPASWSAHVRASLVLRRLDASWKDAAPGKVKLALAACRDYVPGYAGCRLLDSRTAGTPIVVSVLVDPREKTEVEQTEIPETWEIVALRSVRFPDEQPPRLKSITRWPARGPLRDRALASTYAAGRYLAFVPQLDPAAVSWIGQALDGLLTRPETAMILRDSVLTDELDPCATFVVRRDVWAALGGYDAGPSITSPRSADVDLVQRVRHLGYRVEGALEVEPKRYGHATPRPRGDSEIVVFTAITNRYDRLRPLEQRRVKPARQIAFLDQTTRSAGQNTGNWEVRVIDWHDHDPNRRAKLPKIRPDVFFPDAEYSLWIDGNVSLTYPFDIRRLIELYLAEADLCVVPHHARSCIYQEAEACKMRRLDSAPVIDRQMARYREEGFPEWFGLNQAVVILRRHSDAVNDFNRRWWEEIARGSRRDQLSFNYVLWKTGLPVAEFPLAIQNQNGLFAKVSHRQRRPLRYPAARDLQAMKHRLEARYFGPKGRLPVESP